MNNKVDNLISAAWISVAIFVSIFVAYSGNGYEWRYVYGPAAQQNFTSGAVVNPAYILFIFRPLALLPIDVAVFVLSLLSFGCIHLASRLTGANRWLILLFSQTIYILLVGQIDLWIMGGVALGYYALKHNKGILLGGAVAVLLLKPQLGAVLALVYFLQSRQKIQALATLAGIVLASFVLFGFWVPGWLNKIFSWGQRDIFYNISLYPYGILLFILPLIFRKLYNEKQWYSALMSSSMLSVPYSAEYSVVATLAFAHPVWFYALSWPIIYLPQQVRGVILPLSLIIYPLLKRNYNH